MEVESSGAFLWQQMWQQMYTNAYTTDVQTCIHMHTQQMYTHAYTTNVQTCIHMHTQQMYTHAYTTNVQTCIHIRCTHMHTQQMYTHAYTTNVQTCIHNRCTFLRKMHPVANTNDMHRHALVAMTTHYVNKDRMILTSNLLLGIGGGYKKSKRIDYFQDYFQGENKTESAGYKLKYIYDLRTA